MKKYLVSALFLVNYVCTVNAQYAKGFFDWEPLKRISDYRAEIVDSIRPVLKQYAAVCKIHSDFIETPVGACTFDDKDLIPALGTAKLEPIYPGLYLYRKTLDKTAGHRWSVLSM